MPWDFDPHHSLIEFSAKHLGIATLKGFFSRAQMTIDLNEEDITRSSVEAVIDAASVDVHYQRATELFRSEAHLDAERYPSITFRSRRIEPRGDHYAMLGELTLHGCTREMEWEATFNGEAIDHFGRTRRGFSASTVILLSDYSVPSGGRPGEAGDETVRVNLEVELLKRAEGESAGAERRSRSG